jgi:glutamine synthetase
LRQAIEALEKDHEFLLCGGVFDEGQISEWIMVKSDEHYAVLNRPHPFEMELYFDA